MPDQKNRLFMYEALELRAEYDARSKTLRECLPEGRRSRDRVSFMRDSDDARAKPAPDFDVPRAREEVRGLETRRRKLNAAIQKANFAHVVKVRGEEVPLSEALEIRKSLNEHIGELHTQVLQSAYHRVIYKEDRDIVEQPEVQFTEAVRLLDVARREFREVNRALRAAGFTIVIEYVDET